MTGVIFHTTRTSIHNSYHAMAVWCHSSTVCL